MRIISRPLQSAKNLAVAASSVAGGIQTHLQTSLVCRGNNGPGTAAWKVLSTSCSPGLLLWEVTAGEGQGQQSTLHSATGVGHLEELLCTSTKGFNGFCLGQIVSHGILVPHLPWRCRGASVLVVCTQVRMRNHRVMIARINGRGKKGKKHRGL